jgi:hypothetical protein
MPRPEHEPTDAQRLEAQSYAAVGVPHDQIGLLLGISKPTLIKHYRRELDIGKARANSAVGKSLFKQATSGNTAAAIFWMKAQAGWRETQVIENRGALALEGMSDVELGQLVDLVRAELVIRAGEGTAQASESQPTH